MSLPVPPYFAGTPGAGPYARGAKRSVWDLMLTAIQNLGGGGVGLLDTPTLEASWQAVAARGIPQYSRLGTLVIWQGACEVTGGAVSNGSTIIAAGGIDSLARPDVALTFNGFNGQYEIHPDGSMTYLGFNGFDSALLLGAAYRTGGS